MKILKARYAVMPITSTNMEFIVQITSPLQLVPIMLTAKAQDFLHDSSDVAKFTILDFWHTLMKDNLKGYKPDDACWGFIDPISGVELTECNLLTPKSEKSDGRGTCAACGSHESSWNLDEVD